MKLIQLLFEIQSLLQDLAYKSGQAPAPAAQCIDMPSLVGRPPGKGAAPTGAVDLFRRAYEFVGQVGCWR